jgi:hypothetical protein
VPLLYLIIYQPDDLVSSVVIFVVAFSIALSTLIAHRKILPQLVIWIGNEKQTQKPLENSNQDKGER